MYNNGDVFDGQWIENIRQGQGTLKFTDGYLYKGSFFNDDI